MELLTAVLLDIDGTLVDSNDAHAHAWRNSLQEEGLRVPFDKVRRLIGMGADKLLPALIGIDSESLQGQRISRRRAEIFREQYLPFLQAFPAAMELLEQMHACGLKLGVASSARKDELHALLRLFSGQRLIDALSSSDDVTDSKPDPDIVHAALARLNVRADQAIMLGDTPYDVEAARHAGMNIVALHCGGWSDEELDGAMAIFDDPADLYANFNSSPFGLLSYQKSR